MIADTSADYRPQPIPWVPEDEWRARVSLERDPQEAMADPIWRIANLYEIKNRAGEFVPFIPKPEQKVIIWDIYVRLIKNLILPKARRLGCSTCLMLIATDRTAWIKGHKAMLIDQTLDDGKFKLSDMVRGTWDRLPAETRAEFVMSFNAKQFSLMLKGQPNDGVSTLRLVKSGRGGEAHFLVVSEWGTIQFEDQLRSTEIKTGGMVAAQFGIRVIETTWKGGKGGDVWSYVEAALELPDSEKGPHDWFIRFFPWNLDPDYSIAGDYSRVDQETNAYLDLREAEISTWQPGFAFTPGQRLWYWMEKRQQGLKMKREFPTVLRECWEAPIEGAIYAAELDKARTSGRVINWEIDRTIPVDLFFDLGAPANTACWYAQHHFGRRLLVDYDAGLDVTLAGRCQHIKAKGYTIGTIYIPHDGAALQKGGVSYQKEFQQALRDVGLPDRVVVVPRTRDVWLGINEVLMMFGAFQFHATHCKDGIDCLDAYRRKEDKLKKGTFLDDVVVDWAGHSCDALRTLAEARLANFLPNHTESIMTNAYFDPPRLRALASAAVGKHAGMRLGVIIQPDGPQFGRPHVFIPEAGGWLRMWEAPIPGHSYIITMTGKALAVWRQRFRDDHNKEINAAMVAAILPDPRTHQPIMGGWAAELSLIYGHCPVVPDITSGPGWVGQLQGAGVPIYSRRVAPQDKRAGQVKPLRKSGWEMTEDVWRQAMSALQFGIDELDVWCSHAIAELGMVISGDEDTPTTIEGSGSDWVDCAAMAVTVMLLATPWQMSRIQTVTRPHWDHGGAPALDSGLAQMG